MALASKRKKMLKIQAHHLKPVIRIGQKGVTDNVVKETRLALDTHGLIKIHIQQGDKDARHADAMALAERTGAECVHQIGKTFIFYRQPQENS
ncbi:MAG: ribosome assembly RNA-binding protein YhbY [Mariprofundaceae bacterium]